MLSFVITFFSWYLVQFLRQETKFLRQETKFLRQETKSFNCDWSVSYVTCFFVASTVFGFSLDISEVFVNVSQQKIKLCVKQGPLYI